MNIRPENKKPKVLIIDDEQAILQTLQASLKDEQFNVQTLDNSTQALDVITKYRPDAILLDIFMPHCDGSQLLSSIKEKHPDQEVIVISGFGTIPLAIDMIKKGARDFIEKPLNFDEILEKLQFLKQEWSAGDTSRFLPFGIAGSSALFCEFLDQLAQLAKTNFPVLLYGPRGSGKSLYAHYIHRVSKQKQHPATLIDCAQVHTIKSTSFQQPGTVILKNIHLLSPSRQQRILEELNNPKLEARIIATATPDLFSNMTKGLFDATLFYKLNVVPQELPTLAKRKEDIKTLINYFLDQANQICKKNVALSNGCKELLSNYKWPGDVTQLKNVITYTVAQAPYKNHVINPEDIVHYFTNNKSEEQFFDGFGSLEEAQQAFEKKFIFYLLKKNGYNIFQLSQALKVNTAQLRDKLKKLNVLANI
ncbi:MAG: sigma-54-dependent Fis family transcriptional regulator [Epsilonproteobacteria bacterium]|nr:sigma-54-dependent Fis family transcriptional regulator [Campylobacterota bacterium]